jgi:predicted transposase/invertase (TIGR01784 family)
VFKRIFGDPRNSKLLAAFLMAALGLPEEDFHSLAIIDPHLKREFNNDKESILDVKVRLKSGVVIDVELQVRIVRDLRQRIAFANAKMLTEQIKRGEECLSIKRVVSIVICDGVLLPEKPGYYSSLTSGPGESLRICWKSTCWNPGSCLRNRTAAGYSTGGSFSRRRRLRSWGWRQRETLRKRLRW